MYAKKFFEVQDGTTETNHGIIDYAVIVSRRFWEGLPTDVRADLERIMHEVTADRNKKSYELNQASRAKVIEAGGVVRTLTDEQRAAWVAAMMPVWAKFEVEIGADMIAAAQASNN